LASRFNRLLSSDPTTTVWSVARFLPGDEWSAFLDNVVHRVDAAVLFLSPDFFSSRAIKGERDLLERMQKTRNLAIFSLIVKPSNEPSTSNVRALNDRPLEQLSKKDQEDALIRAARHLQEFLSKDFDIGNFNTALAEGPKSFFQGPKTGFGANIFFEVEEQALANLEEKAASGQ